MSAVEPGERSGAWLVSRRRVTARTSDGCPHASGRVVAYYDRPTVTIETDDGERVHWMAHLVDADPVDDPSKDAVGTVRIRPGDPAAVPVLVILTDDATAAPWHVFHGSWPGTLIGYGHDEVRGWERLTLADVAHLLRHDDDGERRRAAS